METAQATAASTVAASPSLSRNRSFNLLWGSQLLSDLGSNMSSLAIPLLVLALTGSAVAARTVGTAAALARLTVRLPAGVLADRVDRRRAMLLCDAVRLVAYATLATLVATGHAEVPSIMAVAVTDSIAGTVFGTVESAALRSVVPLTSLPTAVARNQARSAAAALAGPPLGGVLFSVARAVPFFADAVSYLSSLIGVALIRQPLQQERTEPAGGVGSELREGIRFAFGEPFVRAVLLMSPPIDLAFNGLLFGLVIILRKHGVAPGLIGTVDTIIAIGALLGAACAGVLIHRLRTRTLLLSIYWFGTAMVAVSALLTSTILVAVPLALVIFLSPACNAAIFARQAAVTPDHLQGRVVSINFFASNSLAAFAPLLAGALYTALGGAGTVLTFAAVMAVGSIIVTVSKGMRNIREIASI